jgi:hypothetical protein
MPSFNTVIAPLMRRRDSRAEKQKKPWLTLPAWVKLPMLQHFNFILLHYVYLIVMTLFCSILVYPAGETTYTDALFHATGAATQSGLNTYVFAFAILKTC